MSLPRQLNELPSHACTHSTGSMRSRATQASGDSVLNVPAGGAREQRFAPVPHGAERGGDADTRHVHCLRRVDGRE